ncbi:MAG TPA: calcium-binding protein [Thermoleophilaceae bacterium]|nr:calcium-binding protein [Thermoleophilaceae bacterium]
MRRFLIAAAALATLALPAAAQAATATTADGSLRYTAAAGEANNVTFTRVSGDTFRATDLGTPITAGTGCTQESPNVVSCTTQPGRPLIANLGDQDDSAFSRTSRAVQLFGEDGNDSLAGWSGRDTLDGGAGDDNITGGSGADRLRGGAGNDQLAGNQAGDNLQGGDGNDLLDGGNANDTELGGSGDDTLREGNAPNGADSLAGDAGSDTVDYSARTAPVNVAVDDQPGDGDRRSTERDNVRSTIERVLGSAASDVLIGREVSGDTLVGGPGDDVLDPLRGDDHADGGPGIDQVRLRDLSSDDVVCGDGVDSVAADDLDEVAPDCEKTRRTAAMSLAVAGRAAYPTVMVRLVCPPTAFKECGGRVIIRTLGKVKTRTGKRTLTVGVRRFSVRSGGERTIGVRIRGSTAPFLGRRGLVVRAELSAFDGAGPARKDAVRFRLLPG